MTLEETKPNKRNEYGGSPLLAVIAVSVLLGILGYGLREYAEGKHRAFRLRQTKLVANDLQISALRSFRTMLQSESIKVVGQQLTNSLPTGSLWRVTGGVASIEVCYPKESSNWDQFRSGVKSSSSSARDSVCSGRPNVTVQIVDRDASNRILVRTEMTYKGQRYQKKAVFDLDRLRKVDVPNGDCSGFNFATVTGNVRFNLGWPAHQYNQNKDEFVPPFFNRPAGSLNFTLNMDAARFWAYTDKVGTSIKTAFTVQFNNFDPAPQVPFPFWVSFACPSTSCSYLHYQAEILNANTPLCRVVYTVGDIKRRTDTGCFAPDTKMLLYDGSTRNISNLLPGDQLVDPRNGQPRTVRRVVSGPEDRSMIDIHTDGNGSIRVTTDHPMLLPNGNTARADSISTGDVLVRGDGSSIVVTKVTITDPSKVSQVFNLEFENEPADGSAVVANGLMTGALEMQRQLDAGSH